MGIQQVWELKDGGDIAEYQVRSPAPAFWGGWKSHRNDLKGLIFFKLAETTKKNTVGWKWHVFFCWIFIIFLFVAFSILPCFTNSRKESTTKWHQIALKILGCFRPKNTTKSEEKLSRLMRHFFELSIQMSSEGNCKFLGLYRTRKYYTTAILGRDYHWTFHKSWLFQVFISPPPPYATIPRT